MLPRLLTEKTVSWLWLLLMDTFLLHGLSSEKKKQFPYTLATFSSHITLNLYLRFYLKYFFFIQTPLFNTEKKTLCLSFLAISP